MSDKTVVSWLEENLKNYDLNIDGTKKKMFLACAKELKSTFGYVRKRYYQYASKNNPQAVKREDVGDRVKNNIEKLSVDASEVKKGFDVPAMIRDRLISLGNKVIKDQDFRAALGIGNERWSKAANLEEFDMYRRKFPSSGFWWGKSEVLDDIQNTVDII